MKEHYFIYDGNALVADIGGYFCMFLSLNRFFVGVLNFFVEKGAVVFCGGRPKTSLTPVRPMGGITQNYWARDQGN